MRGFIEAGVGVSRVGISGVGAPGVRPRVAGVTGVGVAGIETPGVGLPKAVTLASRGFVASGVGVSTFGVGGALRFL